MMGEAGRLEHSHLPQDLQLFTTRLILRRLIPDDIPDLQKHANDWEIFKSTLKIPYPYKESDGTAFVEYTSKCWDEGEAYIFGIFQKETGSFRGVCGIDLDKLHRRGLIGYWIARKFWGHGYVTEALKEVLRVGFEKLQLRRIHGSYFVGNDASLRVMEKAGMKKEGVQRSHTWKVHEEMNLCKPMDVGLCAILYEFHKANHEWKREHNEQERGTGNHCGMGELLKGIKCEHLDDTSATPAGTSYWLSRNASVLFTKAGPSGNSAISTSFPPCN